MLYEKLLREAQHNDIEVYEQSMKPTIKGLYCDKIVWINRRIPTNVEKACVLAEELGHYHTSTGDILDQKSLSNRKQEKRARNWAYERLVPLSAFVQAHKEGIKSKYELAEFLDVTEEFLHSAIKHYQEKYGLSVQVGKYTICFEPLGVLELFEE